MNKMNKKNILKTFILVVALAFSGFVFSACSNDNSSGAAFYMVSYISRVGDVPKPVKVKEGTLLSLEHLPELTMQNYTFNGWYIEDKRIYPASYAVTNNTVLTASWTGKECTVTFTHSDNVGGNTFTNVYNLGDKIILPENPYGDKTGLEFLGWHNGSVYYREGEELVLQNDLVLTAVYAELGTHTISYYNVVDGALYEGNDFNGIEYLIGNPNPASFTESQTVFISDLKKIGYTFDGWYTNVDCLAQDKAKTFWRAGQVLHNVNLFAKWTMDSYIIEFNGNSGTLIDANDVQESFNLTLDDEITLPECKYELSGYDFVGWTLDAENFENEFDQNVKISVASLAPFARENTITLYAHWRDAVLPTIPTQLEVTYIDESSVTVEWLPSNSKDLAFTRLYYRKKDETVSTFVDFLAEDNIYDRNGDLVKSSYTVRNLELGELYYFTITSFDVAGNSSVYNSDCTVCAVPRPNRVFVPELTFKQNSPTELTVSWVAPAKEEYPNIEKVSIYMNNSLIEAFSGQNGQGECYTQTESTLTIEPLELYKIQLKVDEITDESGRTNKSQSAVYSYFSEPGFNASKIPVNMNGEEKVAWHYETELGFSLQKPDAAELPQGFTDDSYGLYAECTPLDSEGKPDESLKTIGKLVFDNERGVYIRSNLELATDYKVQIFTGVTMDFNGESYTSYSRACAIDFVEPCSTNSVRGSKVGYICYSSTNIYSEVQLAGTPIGIVTKVSNLYVPVTIMALANLCDSNGDIITVGGLNEAMARVKNYTEGGFIWNIPSKDEINTIFDDNNAQSIFAALEAAGGQNFAPSIIDDNGLTNGRYISSTTSTADNIWVFDIDQYNNCGNPSSVPAQNSGLTFVIRPVVRFSF